MTSDGRNVFIDGPQRIEDEYVIIHEIDTCSVTNLHEIVLNQSSHDHQKTTDKDDDNSNGISTNDAPNSVPKFQLFLVEQRETSRRYNAYCMTFNNYRDTIQYCNDNWRQRVSFTHEHLVPIHNIFIQREDEMDDNSCYHVYIIKERYSDTFRDFIGSKKEHKTYLNEKTIVEFIAQMLASILHLHSRGFIHAPGEINADRIFIGEMYSVLLLDVGTSSKFVTREMMLRKQHEYLRNPYVPPECKAYLLANSDIKKDAESYMNTEKGDVYSVGIVIFIMITLMADPIHLTNFFLVPRTRNYIAYLSHLKEQIIAMTSTANYSPKLIDLVIKMIHPSPEKRATIKQLVTALSKGFADEEERELLSDPVLQQQSFLRLFQSASESEAEDSNQASSSKRRWLSLGQRKNVKKIRIRDKTMKFSKNSPESIAEAQVIREGRILIEGTLRKSKNGRTGWMPRYYYLTDYNYLYACTAEKDPTSVTRKIKLIPFAYEITQTNDGFKLTSKEATFFFTTDSAENREKWINMLRKLSYNPRALPIEIDLDTIRKEEPSVVVDIWNCEAEQRNEFEKQLQTLQVVEGLNIVDEQTFSVLNCIGSGSFGTVYAVNGIGLGIREKLAMKVMTTELEASEFEQFYGDLRCLLTMNHENIMKLKGLSYTKGRICFYYDYISFGSCDLVLNQYQATLTFSRKLDVFKKVAQAMAYLHSKDVVHGHLKPKNILIDKDFDRVMVSDFGFSNLKQKLIGKSSYNILFQYIPPEKMSPSPDNDTMEVAKAGDVYNFAIIMAELLTGEPWTFANNLYPTQIMTHVQKGYRPNLPKASALVARKILPAEKKKIYSHICSKILEKAWGPIPCLRPSFNDIVSLFDNICNAQQQQ